MLYFLIGGVLILLSLGYFLKISARKLAIEGLPEGKMSLKVFILKGERPFNLRHTFSRDLRIM